MTLSSLPLTPGNQARRREERPFSSLSQLRENPEGNLASLRGSFDPPHTPCCTSSSLLLFLWLKGRWEIDQGGGAGCLRTHAEAAKDHLSWLRLGRAVGTCDLVKTCSGAGLLKRPREGRGWPGYLESRAPPVPVFLQASGSLGFPQSLGGRALRLCRPSPLQGRPLAGSVFCPKTLPGKGSGLYPGAGVKLEVGTVGFSLFCPVPLVWTYSCPTVSGKTLPRSRPPALLSLRGGSVRNPCS